MSLLLSVVMSAHVVGQVVTILEEIISRYIATVTFTAFAAATIVVAMVLFRRKSK